MNSILEGTEDCKFFPVTRKLLVPKRLLRRIQLRDLSCSETCLFPRTELSATPTYLLSPFYSRVRVSRSHTAWRMEGSALPTRHLSRRWSVPHADGRAQLSPQDTTNATDCCLRKKKNCFRCGLDGPVRPLVKTARQKQHSRHRVESVFSVAISQSHEEHKHTSRREILRTSDQP